jgi:hypothetical protein
MERALGATGIEKYASPDGVVHHARIRESVVSRDAASGDPLTTENVAQSVRG